jgi:hypothetical protein
MTLRQLHRRLEDLEDDLETELKDLRHRIRVLREALDEDDEDDDDE